MKRNLFLVAVAFLSLTLMIFSPVKKLVVKAVSDLWLPSGNNIYNTNTGKIVVGTDISGLKLDIMGNGDATGVADTGILEIGGRLRLDGNEIITNTGTALNLQAGNNGDLRIDSSTFAVDSSANRVGIGTTSPASNLHLYLNDTAVGGSAGLTIEQDGTGDAKMHYLLTDVGRWVTGVDNSDANKFKIGQGSNWSVGPYIIMEPTGNVVVKLGN